MLLTLALYNYYLASWWSQTLLLTKLIELYHGLEESSKVLPFSCTAILISVIDFPLWNVTNGLIMITGVPHLMKTSSQCRLLWINSVTRAYWTCPTCLHKFTAANGSPLLITSERDSHNSESIATRSSHMILLMLSIYSHAVFATVHGLLVYCKKQCTVPFC